MVSKYVWKEAVGHPVRLYVPHRLLLTTVHAFESVNSCEDSIVLGQEYAVGQGKA